MQRNALDVDNAQFMAFEERGKRRQREVAEVFVVDRVELEAAHQFEYMRNLDHGYPARFEKLRETGHETVKVGHVSEDVVGVDDVSTSALSAELCAELGPEETHEGRDAPAGCQLGDVPRGLDA